MHILILYASLEGQTAKIASHIAQVLRNKDHKVTYQTVDNLPADFDLGVFDAAIIAGSIHMSHYSKLLTKFVKQHIDILNSIPTALITVCMAIHSKIPESRLEASRFGATLSKETGWHPTLKATFAGAVKYTQYNFITRFIMKKISQKEGGSTDTSHDHEYTDWEAVARFAEQFARKISEPQPA